MRCRVGARLSSTGWSLDDLLEDVPDLLVAALEHLLGGLDRVGEAELLEAADDERLEELQRDLLGQAALVQLQLGTDDDDRARRVVDALAEQVLAEAALLALDHVGQGLERAVARAEHRAAAAAVVEQRVDRLLQHPLLVADDDLGRVEVEQLLEAVVAVDQAPVEVVQVAGGEVAGVEQHQRAQVRRDDRDHVEDHPLRACCPSRAASRRCCSRLMMSFCCCLERVALELLAQLARAAAARSSRRRIFATASAPMSASNSDAVLLARDWRYSSSVSSCSCLERRVAGVDDDVVLEVDHPLEVRGLACRAGAEPRGHRLEEPDVRDRRGQVDVPHALAAHAAVRDHHAALVADDALVLDALVLAAAALPVLLGTEDALAEQAVPLRAVGAVVDRLRLLDLAVGPGPDVLRRGQADGDAAVVVDAVRRWLRPSMLVLRVGFEPGDAAVARSSRTQPRLLVELAC